MQTTPSSRSIRVKDLGGRRDRSYNHCRVCGGRTQFVEELVDNDFIYLAIMFALFGISVLFISFCDKIIGPDEAALSRGATDAPAPEFDESGEVAA